MAHPDWLKNFPDWLSTLAEDPEVAALGLTWIASEAEGQARAQGMAEEYAGEGSPLVPLPAHILATSHKMLGSKVVVATGPRMPMRVSATEIESLFLIDPSRPDELLFALSRDYPPFLWISAGTTAAEIRAAFSGYFPPALPPRAKLHRIVRYFFGNERMLDTDIYGVENHYVASPFTAELSWGSAMPEDPWPARIEGAAEAESTDYMINVRERARQDERAIYTTSFRLQHSRGVLTLEDHGGMFVVEVRYLPAPNRDVVVGLNRRFELTFPSDMPVDGVAALLGLSLQTDTTLKDTLSDHELAEDHDLVLHALAALKYNDFTLATDFRPFLRPHAKTQTKPGSLRAPTIPPPPTVRDAAVALAQDLDLDFMLLKTAAVKTEKDALVHLVHALEREPATGFQGPHGAHLLLANDAVVRQSIDWIWGDQDWELAEETPRGPEQMFERAWRTRDGDAVIRYVEDHRLGARFFTIEGKGRDAALTRLRSAVALDDTEQAIVAAESAADAGDRAGAILRVARLAPSSANPRWIAMLESGVKHDSAAVRAASVLAAAWIGWPELVAVVRHIEEMAWDVPVERAVSWIERRGQSPAG
jgi:hypothetical protein